MVACHNNITRNYYCLLCNRVYSSNDISDLVESRYKPAFASCMICLLGSFFFLGNYFEAFCKNILILVICCFQYQKKNI